MASRVRIAFAALGLIGVSTAAVAGGRIQAVGIENQYADVIAQIGGKAADVQAILNNPNSDPHTFEANPKIAAQLAKAQLVVENGVGYDTWADKIMSATPRPARKVIVVQTLLGLPTDTANPHLWYDPKAMPAVARAVEGALSELDPDQASTFHANADKFIASLEPWNEAIAAFKARYGGTPVATTEPVADYLLTAMGFKIMTPFSLEKAIMDGTDPAPQDVSTENGLFSVHKVQVFAYNQQVTDALTGSFLAASKAASVPVVGVYETMPTPGYSYQSWMLAEVEALRRAVADQASTEALRK